MKAALFDLGGTLWEPFGDLTREEVVERAAREAAASLPAQLLEGVDRPSDASLRGRFASELIRGVSVPHDARGKALERGDFSHESFLEVRVEDVVREAFREVFGSDTNYSPCALLFGHALTRYSRPYPESVQVLSQVREFFPDIRIGIVSNTVIQEEVIRHYLHECRLDPYLDFLVCSSTVGWRKPHPAIYALALHKAGVRAADAVFVGDRVYEDVHGPRRLGMKAILVWRGSFLSEDPRANAIAYALESVPGLIRRFSLGL